MSEASIVSVRQVREQVCWSNEDAGWGNESMNADTRKKPRLLLVDDEPANIRILANVLGDDYALTFATSGEEALRQVDAGHKPHMILLDIFMSGMDGFEVCAKLKADKETADIPIIFVSALDDRINEGRGLQLGAVDYIHKPLKPAIVQARVKVHLELECHRNFLSSLLKRRSRDLEAAQDEVALAVDALHESEQSFRSLIEGSIQGIVIQRDWRPVFANTAFAKILGYDSPDEIMALDSLEATFAPHERARLKSYGQARHRGGYAPTHYEFDAIAKDGTTLTLQSIVSATRWQGEPATQVAVIDVSERQRAAEELRIGRERFKDYAESSSDWWWEIGSDLRFTYVGERGRKLLGLPGGEAAGLAQPGANAFDLVTDGHKRREAQELLQERKPFRGLEIPTRDASGATRYLRVSGKPLFGTGGDFQGYRGVATEITDVVEGQRQANALRDAINHATDGVALLDKDRCVVFTNDAFHESFPDLPPKNVITGASLAALIESDTKDGVFKASLARVRRDRSANKQDMNADGVVEVHANDRTYLRRERSSNDGGLLMLFTDITGRKAAERERDRYHSELRRLAAEVSLTEEKERRRIAAELHDGAVQHLGVSRVKLGTIRSKLATPGGGSQDLSAQVNEIVDLLDRSIGEIRSLMSELSTSMLYELGLDPAIEWLASRFEASHELRCKVQSQGTPVELSTDLKVTVFQSVRELLANVAKHAKATRASVVVLHAPDLLTVHVHDDGIGLPSERTGLHPSGDGGFGLFSVRERLGALGGGVTIDRANGTTVSITVPLAD
ncbi:MAG: PAS domain S-box protein [Gammaproteobacteria bacterium]